VPVLLRRLHVRDLGLNRRHREDAVLKILLTTLIVGSAFFCALPVFADDPGHINGYVTPYFDSSGPVIRVGKYSSGLLSKVPGEFVRTIIRMKNQWNDLNFTEIYAAAIRLYDLGYRNEATYWFYTAQYRGAQFALLVDQKKLGSTGDRGFELYHAQEGFFKVAGPTINGYAYGDVDSVVSIIRRVQSENHTVPNVKNMYPGVAFLHMAQWQGINAELNAGWGRLATQLASRKNEIKQQRIADGTQARFSHLTSRRFPGGL